MSKPSHKVSFPVSAWEQAGLRGHPDLPPPAIVPPPGELGQVCYIGDVALAKKVLALLKEHAGDPWIDRAILMASKSTAFRGASNES